MSNPKAIRSGRALFGPHKDGVLALLGQFAPGLVVDVGAGFGHYTDLALQYSPSSHALCFEPFSGNWPFLEKRLAGQTNVRILHQAVAEAPGQASFYVGATAKAEGYWAEYSGYSSAGYIVPPGKTLDPNRTRTVPVTTIDENVAERVLFLKIDVQGGELNVLKGAAKTFDRGVDLTFIEFGGEREVLQFLLDRDYQIYDHAYLLIPTVKAPDLSSWDVIWEGKLSSGQPAYRAWPRATPADPKGFCAMFRAERPKVGAIYTDIVAIRPGLTIS